MTMYKIILWACLIWCCSCIDEENDGLKSKLADMTTLDYLKDYVGENALDEKDPDFYAYTQVSDQPSSTTILTTLKPSTADSTTISITTNTLDSMIATATPNPTSTIASSPTGPHKLCPDSGNETGPENLLWTEPGTILIPILQNTTFYNKFIAPGQPYNKTTTVNVGIYIESMSSFRTQSGDFDVDMYLALSWIDKRLEHNCLNPILITDTTHANLFWVPDLYFMNSKSAHFHTVTTPNFMMLIYKDGLVFKSMRLAVTLACNMDLARFPLDNQTCFFQIQSYAYVERLVTLTWFHDKEGNFPISKNPSIRLNNMEISNMTVDDCTEKYPMFIGYGSWSCIKGIILLKRHVTFFVFQIYVPTAMLVAISWLSFWLDMRASPARISLTITTLLTLTTMGNSVRQDLPQVSYVKAIDIWLSVCTGFVFSVLLEYTIVNFFIGHKTTACQKHTRPTTVTRNGDKAGQPLRSAPIVVTEYSRSCSVCAARWERYAKHVDRTSRVAFPMAFGFFVIIYCTICSHFTHVFDKNPQ